MVETDIESVRHDLGFSTEPVKAFVMEHQTLEFNMAVANCFVTARLTPVFELVAEKVSELELAATASSLERDWDCRLGESTSGVGSEVIC